MTTPAQQKLIDHLPEDTAAARKWKQYVTDYFALANVPDGSTGLGDVHEALRSLRILSKEGNLQPSPQVTGHAPPPHEKFGTDYADYCRRATFAAGEDPQF